MAIARLRRYHARATGSGKLARAGAADMVPRAGAAGVVPPAGVAAMVPAAAIAVATAAANRVVRIPADADRCAGLVGRIYSAAPSHDRRAALVGPNLFGRDVT